MILSAMDILKQVPAAVGWSYDEAFKRNLGLITHEEQQILKRTTIAIPGLGGVGGSHLMTLARMGFGGFHIADQDKFSVANFNRQYGAMVSTFDRPKLDVMDQLVRDVNPQVRLQCWDRFIDESNVDEFLTGVDLVIDSVDAFAIDARLLLFRKAAEKKIPIITAGPIGFSTSMLVQTPESVGLSRYLNISPTMSDREKFIRFIVGLTPRPRFLKYMKTGNIDMKNHNGPCLASSVNLCAAFAAVEAVKLILGRGKVYPLPWYHYYDPYISVFKRGKLLLGNRHPLQRLLIWYIDRYKIPRA